MGLSVSLAEVPVIDFSPSGGSTVWPFEFAFTVTPAAGGPAVPAFDFIAYANATLKLGLSTNGNLVIQGELDYLGATLLPGNSTVGPISGLPLLQDLVSFTLTDIVLPSINKALIPGIPLPAVPHLTFTQSEIGWGSGYASLGLNFQYTPPLDFLAAARAL